MISFNSFLGLYLKCTLRYLSLIFRASLSFLGPLFNPMRPGGGGGLRGPDGQTHTCQSETSYPMMPKLSNF